MGTEIDVAYRKWVKEPQTLFRPIIEDEYIIGNNENIFDYYRLFSEIGNLSYSEDKFICPYFDKENLGYYYEPSAIFLAKIKEFTEISNQPLHDWFLKQEGKVLIFQGLRRYYSAIDVESFITNRWCGEEEIPFNECGKALFSIIPHVSNNYGLNLYPAMIYYAQLFDYDEESKEGKELDEKLLADTTYLAKEIEQFFSSGVAKEEKHYDILVARLTIIYEIIKQGGKMIWSS